MATILTLFALLIAGVSVVGVAVAWPSPQATNDVTVGILLLSTFGSLVFAAILGALAVIVDRLQKIHVLLARINRESPDELTETRADVRKEPELQSFPRG